MITELNEVKLFTNLTIFIDGGCEPKNPGGVATSGWVIYSLDQKKIATGSFVTCEGGPLSTNNFGEYSALKLVLSFLKHKGWQGSVKIFADSRLVVNQVQKKWKVNAEHLKSLRNEIFNLMGCLKLVMDENFSISWVAREENQVADALCGEAYQRFTEKKTDQ